MEFERRNRELMWERTIHRKLHPLQSRKRCFLLLCLILCRAQSTASFSCVSPRHFTWAARWLSSGKHLLLLQKTRVWFPAPTLYGSQSPIPSTLRDPVFSSAPLHHLYECMCVNLCACPHTPFFSFIFKSPMVKEVIYFHYIKSYMK